MAAPTGDDVHTAARIQRRWPLISASVAVGLVLVLGVIIAVRPAEPFAVDLRWMAEVVEHRSPVWTAPALFFNYVGGGLLGSVVIPVVIFALLLAFRRPWGAAFFGIASILSVICVQVLKHTVGRARPSDILVTSDTGSFPSGHTANAATMAVVFAILFPRVWVWCAGAAWSLLMAVSRTYLGAHWLSDTIGGLLLGAGVAVIVWAPLAYRLAEESTKPHPFLRLRAGPG
ncbi:phosphatase PAP2 family protein [Leifsonia sp. TF02-11]|uniref:phosphatase PAP2 family protein n=1 Tax=Leifsonia sp. TF02-11 TaxID=2815212 RepID=UPI001AA17EF7|nr:phosphatase PAP2 family protein [Leifsonia sp. TF02-11]MBN9632050.1 phosphatase PAP2 family protein [Actinomycetota bacterium]MBO1739057.1 phosphatase PAP2 family protein [Leifsonia sp. TF02-11]